MEQLQMQLHMTLIAMYHFYCDEDPFCRPSHRFCVKRKQTTSAISHNQSRPKWIFAQIDCMSSVRFFLCIVFVVVTKWNLIFICLIFCFHWILIFVLILLPFFWLLTRERAVVATKITLLSCSTVNFLYTYFCCTIDSFNSSL